MVPVVARSPCPKIASTRARRRDVGIVAVAQFSASPAAAHGHERIMIVHVHRGGSANLLIVVGTWGVLTRNQILKKLKCEMYKTDL